MFVAPLVTDALEQARKPKFGGRKGASAKKASAAAALSESSKVRDCSTAASCACKSGDPVLKV